jgi:hypothetical protein
MKRHILLTIFLTLLVFTVALFTACKKDPCKDVSCKNGGTCNAGSCICPTGYTGNRCETKVLSCVVNNTAEVQFSNRSSNSTYSVIWDGYIITTLAAGVTSSKFVVAAGSHTLEFRYSNSSASSCTPSTPVLAQCSSMIYWCSN